MYYKVFSLTSSVLCFDQHIILVRANRMPLESTQLRFLGTLRTKSTSKHLFLVLQLVTNSGFISVPGRTNRYLEVPKNEYFIFLVSNICVKPKHQKKVLRSTFCPQSADLTSNLQNL